MAFADFEQDFVHWVTGVIYWYNNIFLELILIMNYTVNLKYPVDIGRRRHAPTSDVVDIFLRRGHLQNSLQENRSQSAKTCPKSDFERVFADWDCPSL